MGRTQRNTAEKISDSVPAWKIRSRIDGPISAPDPPPAVYSTVLTEALVKMFDNSADVMLYNRSPMVMLGKMNFCGDLAVFKRNWLAVCFK